MDVPVAYLERLKSELSAVRPHRDSWASRINVSFYLLLLLVFCHKTFIYYMYTSNFSLQLKEWLTTQLQQNIMSNMCVVGDYGTGKTAGAITAIVNQLQNNNDLQSLFFCTTFDASCQAVTMIRDRTTCTCAMVSASKAPMLSEFNIIVGTPNDILNFIEDRKIELKNIRTVCFDDGDLTCTYPKVHAFLARLHEFNSRVIYVAPTISEKLQAKLAMAPIGFGFIRTYQATGLGSLKHFCQIETRNDPKIESIKQTMKFLKQQVVIFCITREQAKVVANELKDEFNVILHSGDLDLDDRKWAVDSFMYGYGQVLIATDALSRGVRFDKVNFVINFSAPTNNVGKICLKRYLSRVSRVGSFGQNVVALSYFDETHFHQLQQKFPVEIL